MKMRTIDQCAAYIKAIDPESSLTKTAIRRMVITGEIPSRTEVFNCPGKVS